jgi:hypothetical protein
VQGSAQITELDADDVVDMRGPPEGIELAEAEVSVRALIVCAHVYRAQPYSPTNSIGMYVHA